MGFCSGVCGNRHCDLPCQGRGVWEARRPRLPRSSRDDGPSMPRPPYTLEWYEEVDGSAPVLRWLREELTPRKRRALGTAMNEILQHLGPGVVDGNFGKALRGGLFEFRLDQDVEEILARQGKKARSRD